MSFFLKNRWVEQAELKLRNEERKGTGHAEDQIPVRHGEGI